MASKSIELIETAEAIMVDDNNTINQNDILQREEALLETKQSGKGLNFHFVRPRKFMFELSFWGGLGFVPVTFILVVLVDSFLNLTPILIVVNVIFTTGVGFALGTFLSLPVCGLIVQIHNATTLSNMLVELCSHNKKTSLQVSQQTKQDKFSEWKEFYKTSIGALHIWSWRMTPFFGSILCWSGILIIEYIVLLISLYTTIMSEPDILESQRLTVFQNIGTNEMGMLLFWTVFLLGFVGLVSMVSVRYKRLHLLVATLNLQHTHLADFNILQHQNAAMQVFDIPITTKTTLQLLKLLFVQSVIIGLAVAG